MKGAFVVAVVATFERTALLRRLLESLRTVGPELQGLVIVDNSSHEEARKLADEFPLSSSYLHTERNLGNGGGWSLGIEAALTKFSEEITHLLILDDDAILPPDAVTSLIRTAGRTGAEVLYPMVMDEEGTIGWFPGLVPRAPWKAIRKASTPAEYLAICGSAPVPFSWSPGVCLLFSARAARAVGLPATDFWLRGEDLDYSLRLTNRFPSAFVPDVIVAHHPPATVSVDSTEYYKHLSMLQNLFYLSTRLSHGKGLLRTLPGNSLLFFRTHGIHGRSVWYFLLAFFYGAIRGKPAGVPGFNPFQQLHAKAFPTREVGG